LTHTEHIQAKRNFTRLFPKQFRDASYVERERLYKVEAHEAWKSELSAEKYDDLLQGERIQ
jgi:hypothetical protein